MASAGSVDNDRTLEEDTRDAFDLLYQMDWIHNFQVTHILKGPLHKIPSEWVSHLVQLSLEELNKLPFLGESSEEEYPDWPASLHQFLALAARLSLGREPAPISPTKIMPGMARGMNPKKLHEVSLMATLVNNIACEADCNLILDVGSGLGYLDHILHQTYLLPVIGLETSESHISRAELRAASQGLKCGGIKSIKFDLRSDPACFEELETVLETLASQISCDCSKTVSPEKRPPPPTALSNLRVCVIGLHCCGDLTPTMLMLCHKLSLVKALCCVSCCYHKMCFSSPGNCPNVPLSSSCKQLYSNMRHRDPGWTLSAQTLRLGAQETRQRWRNQTSSDHASHTRQVAYRGLLELTGVGNPSQRRVLVRKADFSSFDAFLESYLSPTVFSEETVTSAKSTLKELYTKHEKDFDLIEILTALQVIVQPVIESVIYRDRLLWLLEQKSYSRVELIPLFEAAISPRNLAILAVK